MDDDLISNDSRNPVFTPAGASFTSSAGIDPLRRRLLQAGLGSAALAFFGAPALAAARPRPPIGFTPIAASLADVVRVPEGYAVHLLYAWGDPVSDGAAFRPDAGNSAAEQAEQAGMHHDGMQFFPFVTNGKASSTHGLLCVNHEYTDDGLLHPDGMAEWSHAKTLKSQSAHGVSVIEVERTGATGAWNVVRPSRYARRITARTPLRIAGPAAGAPAMRTKDDRRGNVVFGTLNNCAMGATPWGTYLTCEENFDGYFNGTETPTPEQKRYGIRRGGAGYRWHEHDSRFDVATEPNESNRFGWVVEIDPWNPAKPAVKRTALGRFKHEGATVALAGDGRVVVYMGDDERFEYIYKFVSRDRYDPAQPAANAGLLDHGTLYVARFGDDGQGEWLALEHGSNGLTAANGFADQADVLIRTRQAADRAGATKMDRPEWIAVHPQSGEVYCTLTNNSQRGAAGMPPTDAANPRAGNGFGHIIRWREEGGDAAQTRFAWDVFVLCGDPQHADEKKRGTVKGDAFGSPDGLWFDAQGRLWVQTDVASGALNRGDYERLGNNQMLVADVESGEFRRFLTGPKGCEITGITAPPDGRSLFINVQHPGETAGERSDPAQPTAVSNWPASQFPQAAGGRPRSATVVITRLDGGVIGA
ncbi:MAG: Tat pathway signal protein [Candidatus Accumulibacter sp. 66-26]|nr:PhoX family phosphatase [Accumulibacter sp.]OJW46587.1 MAG: Tat pathway signal protein [Candidatus Accumulibacter sp. 66-26]